MKKHFFCITLALVMCLGLTVPAFADQTVTKIIGDIPITTHYEHGELPVLSYIGSGTLTENLLESGLNLLLTDTSDSARLY